MAPKGDAKAKAKAKPVKDEPRPEDKVPKVDQPDRKAFDERIEAVNQEIEKFQKDQAALTAKINERSGGKEEYHQKRAELRALLDEYSGKMNELQARKESIQKAMGDKVSEGREMRQQLNKMKKTIGFTDEGAIDDRIREIEFRMSTESVSLKEEKEMLKEIQELKRNRPKVSQVQKMEASMDTRDTGANLKEDVQAINAEMAAWREKKRGVSEQFGELVESRKGQLGDMSEIILQRDEIGKSIADKIRERTAIRDEFRAAENEFRAYQSEVRKIRKERADEERIARQRESDQRRLLKEAEKLDEQPHVAEITLLEQTILFCQKLLPEKKEEKSSDKKEIVHNNPDDTMVLINKKDRDEEFFFAPTKVKSKKGKAPAKSDSAGPKPIKHNAETFKLFDSLKLNAPITTDDIPPLLEQLEEQLESYKAKVAVWEEKREEMKRKILEEGKLPSDDKEEVEEAKEEPKEETEEKPEGEAEE